MKKLVLSLALAASVFGVARAENLVVFDFNNIPNAPAPNLPSFVSDCVTVTPLSPCDLRQSLHYFGGPDNSKFRCFAGWDSVQYDPVAYFQRSDLAQWPNTLSFDVTVNPDSFISNPALSLDWMRPNNSSPDYLQASVFWQDVDGIIQHWTSGAVELADTGVWNTLDFDFITGSAPFPEGLDTSGETFHIELYAWGGDGATTNVLYLDNVTVKGDCAPIPEPGSALLLAAAGFVILLRRRLR